MHNYHLDRGVPRCAFKVDIQKAYDTVDWGFLREVLSSFGFHHKMIVWIMECVSTTSYSVCVNGGLHGYFKGKRGLRQSDPLSPYLFTLIMEVFTLMLKRRVRESELFTYHRYCSEMEIINLCFADDLFLFAHGDPDSATVIMEALDEFKSAPGLVPSLPKSTAYFCNVLNYTKMAILQILPFEEGCLPVKYLGVPLVSSRLIYRDCKELIEKVQHRIRDWKNKSLSAAGRLQLVKSVIGSMHVYWASVFILPSRVLLDFEQLMRNFLWCQGESQKGKSKVAWEVVCLPKKKGGLGLRRLDLFNKALMVTHIWNLLSRKESLWVKWIQVYKLRGHNFFEISFRGNMTWGWRKILQLWPLIRDHIWYRIGDGATCSLWFDRWCPSSLLASIVSTHDIHRAGLDMFSKVKDVI
ncbi:putative reverse transcriptase domain, reverse transcriptase zinc-binding domain protein, partial [Tanacetum coccineum]